LSAEREGRNAPGPRVYPVIGTMPAFWGKHRLFGNMEHVAKHGDVVRFQMGGGVTHFLQHPDHIRYVVQENHTNYERGGRTGRIMRLFLGDGLITTDGEVWRRQRRLSQPAFHQRRLDGLTTTIAAATMRMLARWEGIAQRGGAVEITEEMLRLSLGVVSAALFGTDLSDEAAAVGHALTVVQEDTNRRLRSLFAPSPRVPTINNLRFLAAVRTLDRIVYGIIAERRRVGGEHDDLLGMLMAARDADGSQLGDRELRDQVLTLIAAGHETTAYALTWAFATLARHAMVERTVLGEVDCVIGERLPTFADVARLVYTRRVVDETLRMYPTVWVFARRAIRDDEVGGYRIPAGSVVAISPYYTHRHPGFWPNPEGFDPERFTPEESAARPKYAYVPFGGGPHLCIGNNFALTEMVVVIAMTLRRFQLDLVPGPPLMPEPLVSLRPSGAVRFTLRSRPARPPSTS
jgi:cytochrome P450